MAEFLPYERAVHNINYFTLSMYVKNINGSGRFSAPSGYSSWLEYWKEKSGESVYSRSASNCLGIDGST